MPNAYLIKRMMEGNSLMTNDNYLAIGFRDVDRNSDLGKLVACLEFLDGLPSFIAYKTRSIERMQLKPGDTAVDLGCGLGFDVRKMAEIVRPGGRAIGVDLSNKLLEAGKRAFADHGEIEFENCDIHRLPFDSNSIDSIRVDRTLQHVADPRKVISEMIRVLKPAGRLVCAEPDWFTFVIDSDDIDMTTRVVERWRSSFKNPSIGRQLLGRIRKEGLKNAWAEEFVLLATGIEAVNIVYDIYETIRILEEENKGDAPRLSSWLRALIKSDKDVPVTASVTLFLAGGQKP